MKRILISAIVLLLVSSLSKVNASDYYSYLPGGKNYIDSSNVEVVNSSFQLIESIKIKSDQDYTFSLPGVNVIGESLNIYINGINEYISGGISENQTCYERNGGVDCTFRTSGDEEYIDIVFSANDLQQYYDYYGLSDIQLEEGLVKTEYEEYIAPDIMEPVIDGAGVFINSYETPLSLTAIISEHLIVQDAIDGDLSSSIVIDYDEYTGYETTIGEYLVSLSVTDNALNTAFFDLTIIIKDEIDPVISGPENITLNYGNTPDIVTVINDNFSYYDGADSVLDLVIIENDYSVNSSIIGTYDVVFSVIDDSLNSVSKQFTITVSDNVSPTLSSSLVINNYLSNPMDLTTIINSLVYSDNYNSFAELSLIIINDTFSQNIGVTGAYSIGIEIKDLSNNVLSKTLTINTIDDVSPVISGPTALAISYENVMSNSELLALLTVGDNYDSLENSNIVITNNSYSSQPNSLGEHIVVFELTDYSGNLTTHSLVITVIDDVSPVIYVDSYIVTINLGSSFSEEDAVKLLLKTNEINEKEYTVTTLLNDYIGNEQEVGNYVYKIKLISDEGEEVTKEFLIKVVDANNSFNIMEELTNRNIFMYGFSVLFVIIIYLKKRF